MGIQARLPETSVGDLIALGPPDREESGAEPSEPREPEGAVPGAEKVSVTEVAASVPLWQWTIPGLVEAVSTG